MIISRYTLFFLLLICPLAAIAHTTMGDLGTGLLLFILSAGLIFFCYFLITTALIKHLNIKVQKNLSITSFSLVLGFICLVGVILLLPNPDRPKTLLITILWLLGSGFLVKSKLDVSYGTAAIIIVLPALAALLGIRGLWSLAT